MDNKSNDGIEEGFLASEGFEVSVEASKFALTQSAIKRLVITRGSHSESLRLNSEEAQQVMITLTGAFHGLFTNLIKAAEPLADLLEGDYEPNTMKRLDVDAGDVTALRAALYAIEQATPTQKKKD
jgi:hypothetical protein